MRAILAIILACAVTAVASPQQATQSVPPSAVVTFTYENDKLVPSYYRLTIHEDGTGTYESRGGRVGDNVSLQVIPFKQQITISEPLDTAVFVTARQHKLFSIPCEASGVGRIAFQGKKTLAYQGPDGAGSCTFNFSQIKQIARVSEDLQSVASTIEAGQRLALQHQHDRLSLDPALIALTHSVAAGSSTELQNIRSVLEEIASDPDVLNRARQSAATLARDGKH